ncbi:hypothetical protein B0H14DRAFT_3172948 [Mycena olivaceomarginata]|nr:hypothetical protein B0H14DRAFT_3172948 [Mycena olivaceomarginata]
MPRQATVTETRLNHTITSLISTLPLLKELNDAFGPPFVQTISNTIETLISMAQNVKHNKEECVWLMENINQVLYAIINLHLKSETFGSLPPATVDNIGKFAEFLEVQQGGSKIKHLFRNNAMQNLLKDCHLGLDKAMTAFRITDSPATIDNIGEMKKAAILAHEELLERIQALSDRDTNSAGSSVYLGANDSRTSSNSFSLLPSKPKIFHGRDSELEGIIQILGPQPVRIAILGGGGMGKTSLARAVLHHPDAVEKFGQRFFVSAEAVTTSIELAALIALHVGLNPRKDLTKPVVQFFARKSPSLLILDNLETVWEPIQSRGGIEEFLSMLTDIEHLTLIQTFMDITDNVYANEDIHRILRFTDNMPLAIDLIAHLSEYEGLSNVLTRWEMEKTALLSASISLSVSSPRMTSDSKELLRLLSILPDGLADAEMVQINLPIPNILSCKATLLATSLAYQDTNKRFRLLMPVREHVQQFLPPSPSLIQSLRNHFHTLLELYTKYHWDQLCPVINEINLNLRNLHNVLQCGLHDKAPDVAETIMSIISLNSFYRVIRVLASSNRHRISDPMQCVTQAITLFEQVSNPSLESKFYHAAGLYFHYSRSDSTQAMQYYQKALKLSKICDNRNQQPNILINIAWINSRVGDYKTGRVYAAEAERVSKLSANLYPEARALWVGAFCSIGLGDLGKQWPNYTEVERSLVFVACLEEYAEARSIYHEIIETSSPDQNGFHYGLTLVNITHSDAMSGNTKDASRKLKKAKDIFSTHGSHLQMIYCSMVEADIDLREERFSMARVKFEECLHSAAGKDNQIDSFCLERLADIGAWPASQRESKWPMMYLAYAYKSSDKLALHKALLFLGDVFVTSKDEAIATSLYIVALDGFTHMDVHRSRAQCMIRLGDLAEAQGSISKAIDLWQTAQPLFQQSSQAKEVAQIDARLVMAQNASQQASLALGPGLAVE